MMFVLQYVSNHKEMNDQGFDLEEFFNLGPDLFCIANQDGYLKVVNRAFSRVLGWSERELLSRPVYEFIHPDDILATQKELNNISQLRESVYFQNRYICKDQSIKVLEWTNFWKPDESIYSVARDITDQVEQARQLQSLTDRLESLLTASPAVVYVARPDGDFGATYVSPNVVEQLGYLPKQFTGDSRFWSSKIHPEDVERVFDEFPALFEHGTNSHDYRYRCADGSYVWIHDQLRVIDDSDGVPKEIVGVMNDISERKLLEAELLKLATTDSLTGLSNRRHIIKLASQELARSKRHKRPFSILIMDVDLFKNVNDKYGHPAGDQVLVALARECERVLRVSDSIGRFGGEEFAAVLAESDAESSYALAERLRKKLAAMSVEVEGSMIQITVSIGVTSLNEESETLDQIISRADNALYQAKKAGRDRVASQPQGQHP